ncbi:FAD-dependent oxidoreductase [Allorhodopirellula solitaria]|nr:FAD-dependent oxidoreductase [Allorhodopirellula solitaria]
MLPTSAPQPSWGLFLLLAVTLAATTSVSASADDGAGGGVLVEAESLDSAGGWKLDTQFIREMGSPYLLAHGLGTPVADASGTVEVPRAGEYRVYVRTKDWVARWGAPGSPGRFQLLVNGEPLETTFGSEGAQWHWQDGGTVQIPDTSVDLALHDLTGFDGRCDAIYLTQSSEGPPQDDSILPAWRRERLDIAEEVTVKDDYDLVVIGGGYSGLGTSISAARSGCRVALIQDRGVLGGNGSSEVRVWAKGEIRRGKYPRIGEIVEELADSAKKSPGTYEEFEDAKKETIVRAEPNIDLFLNHHAYQVEMDGDRIQSVTAFDTKTSHRLKFVAPLFADCTGHATIGYLAGADFDMSPDGRMGMSNMWAWDELDEKVSFPETPWALDLEMQDFPYPRDHHAQWFWESGFDKDAVGDAEGIRDWNLRAAYGAFNAMKNRGGAAEHQNATMTWLAYIGGPRESRRLMGDVLLTHDDIMQKKEFVDGTVPSTWSVDLHYPKKQYAEKFPDNPFISIAVHGSGVDRTFGYPIPYRCFYSRNVPNLFMAGRCISVTHEALGTTRVMKTCGMMGEVIGKAASLCRLHQCLPRDVYYNYWSELDSMLKLPGKAYRETVDAEFVIPADAMELAPPPVPKRARDAAKGIDPKKLSGTVVDDHAAKRSGNWTAGTGLEKFIGDRYLYSSGENAKIRFDFTAAEAGKYEVQLAYQSHENRGEQVSVVLQVGDETVKKSIDMTVAPQIDGLFLSLGTVDLAKDQQGSVTLSAKNAGGHVHADAIRVSPVDK